MGESIKVGKEGKEEIEFDRDTIERTIRERIRDIIDQETWDKVKTKQRAIADKDPGKFWNQRRPKHLLSHLLKCGC